MSAEITQVRFLSVALTIDIESKVCFTVYMSEYKAPEPDVSLKEICEFEGHRVKSVHCSWAGDWRLKECRICGEAGNANNNFRLCVLSCMNIYSAWKTLGIVPEHVRIK